MNENARFYSLLAVLAVVIGAAAFWALNRTPEDLESADAGDADGPISRVRSDQAPSRDTRIIVPTPTPRVSSGPSVTARPSDQASRNRHDIGVITGTVSSTNVSVPATIQIDLHLLDWKRHETPKSNTLVNTVVMDSDAEFEFTGLKLAQYYLHAHGDGVTGDRSRTLTAERPEQATTIDLQQSGVIAGRVTDMTDRPIEGAMVYVSAYRQGDGNPVNTGIGRASYSKVFTDVDGNYVVDSVQVLPSTPLDYKIAAKADGFATQFSEFVPVGAENVDFVLGKGGGVSGTVVEAGTRYPLPNVTVTVGSEGSLDRMDMKTDIEGRFHFAALPPGETELGIVDDHLVSTDDSTKILILEGVELENVTLEAATGGIISGRLYDADTDRGLANELITISPQGFEMNGENTKKTDGRGNYAFTGLAAGTYVVQRREVYGYPYNHVQSQKRVTAKLGDEVVGIDFALSKGLQISGVVVDEKDNPVSDVNVSAQSTEGGGYGRGVSRKDGAFILAGLTPGKYNVRVRKDGVFAPPLGPYELLDESVSGIRIVLKPEASIEGVVVDERGRPVNDILVHAQLDTPQGYFSSFSKESDVRGAFRVGGLTEGTYGFSFSRSGSYTQTSTSVNPPVKVKSGETVSNVRLVVTLKYGISISGRVTDPAGKPIGRVRIQVNGPSWGRAETDAEGHYSVEGLKEGLYRITASHYERTTQKLSGIAANSAEVNFVLRGRGRIEGQVLSAVTRQPITSFSIYQHSNSQSFQPYMNDRFTSFHDPDGRFSLDRVEEGSATVVAKASGYAQGTYQVPNVVADRTYSDVVIYLESGAALEGIVVTSAGEPVRNAMIFEGPVPRFNRERAMKAQSGPDGSFSLESLTPGVTAISAYHPNFAPSFMTVNVSAGKTTYAEIVLTHGGTLEGRVTLAGRAAEKAQVSVNFLQGAGGQQINKQAPTDEDGYYEITGLPDGTAYISCSINIGVSNRNKSTQAELADDHVTVVNFDFSSSTASIEGTITRDGVPQISATVYTVIQSPDGNESFQVQADSEGHYLLEGMPAGAVTLNVNIRTEDPSRPIMRVYSLELSDGEHLRHDIELASGITVQCVLTNLPAYAQQTAVWALRGEVTVNLTMEFFQDAMQGLLAGMAVADGTTARIEGLEPGTYTIMGFAVAGERDPQNPFANMVFTTSPLQIQEGDKEVNVRLDF